MVAPCIRRPAHLGKPLFRLVGGFADDVRHRSRSILSECDLGILKLWWLSPTVLSSFRKPSFRPCLGNAGLAESRRFLSVMLLVEWATVSLLQRQLLGNQNVRSFGRPGPNNDYIWFGTVRAVQVTVNVAGQGRERPAHSSIGDDKLETVTLSVDSRFVSDSGAAGSSASHVINLTSDGGDYINYCQKPPPFFQARLPV